MAYDVELADRLREALAGIGEVDAGEKRMFGGLAFMVGGYMTVCASSGGMMLRVDPAGAEALLADPRASRMVMRGKEMDGWLLVAVDDEVSDEELGRWVEHGAAYARSLPPR